MNRPWLAIAENMQATWWKVFTLSADCSISNSGIQWNRQSEYRKSVVLSVMLHSLWWVLLCISNNWANTKDKQCFKTGSVWLNTELEDFLFWSPLMDLFIFVAEKQDKDFCWITEMILDLSYLCSRCSHCVFGITDQASSHPPASFYQLNLDYLC